MDSQFFKFKMISSYTEFEVGLNTTKKKIDIPKQAKIKETSDFDLVAKESGEKF